MTIEEALRPLERRHPGSFRDRLHQPSLEKPKNEKTIDPHVNLARCITTSGGENLHYSGKRPYTCRELSLFQGFPPNFHFVGSITEAKKQCGNAWPVKANTVYFLTWAAHMEAFDHGFISAEDEVLDLYDFLEKKGISIPKPAPIDVDLFNTPAPAAARREPEYRYLSRIEKTVQSRFPLQIWAQRKELDPLPQRRRRRNNAAQRFNFSSGFEEIDEHAFARASVTVTPRHKRRGVIDDDDEVIPIDDSD